MHTYQVNVTREDRWWIIRVPELKGYRYADGSINVGDATQARRLSEVEVMARDFICTVMDLAPSEVDMNISIDVDGLAVSVQAEEIAEIRERAERYAKLAQAESHQLARNLADRGVPVRDIGDVLGVSFQRAQQLVSASDAKGL